MKKVYVTTEYNFWRVDFWESHGKEIGEKEYKKDIVRLFLERDVIEVILTDE